VRLTDQAEPQGASLACVHVHSPSLHRHPRAATPSAAAEIALSILTEVMQFRRMSRSHSCVASPCPSCLAPHLPNVISAIEQAKPITFVLPAFPGKSPNKAKVLGHLPDMAERRSLEFLERLCAGVKRFHSPGAKIILCSDGRVFSDTVGMLEEDVSAYQKEITRMIEDLALTSVSSFGLESFFSESSYDQMRAALLSRFGAPLEELKEKVRRGAESRASLAEQEATRMYRGITRFLFEDSVHPGQLKSRTALQKEARSKAYELIQRSNAWSELIALKFPDAVRLTIHPQVCGSAKLGIRLISNESWMTPWHGVAVEADNGYVLLKRAEAEALGAQLIHAPNGRPSHYKLSGDFDHAVGVSES
jgi:pyoverdine/dityrosine biosynthesis protein Dit1